MKRICGICSIVKEKNVNDELSRKKKTSAHIPHHVSSHKLTLYYTHEYTHTVNLVREMGIFFEIKTKNKKKTSLKENKR